MELASIPNEVLVSRFHNLLSLYALAVTVGDAGANLPRVPLGVNDRVITIFEQHQPSPDTVDRGIDCANVGPFRHPTPRSRSLTIMFPLRLRTNNTDTNANPFCNLFSHRMGGRSGDEDKVFNYRLPELSLR